MKIATFKRKFSRLSKSDQLTTIKGLKSADVKKDHCHGIPEGEHDSVARSFNDLITWCENHKKGNDEN